MILLPSIPFILSMGIGYYYFTTSLETNTDSSMNRIIEDHKQMIETFLKERKADLEFAVNSFSFKELSSIEMLHRVFTHLQKASNAFVDLGIFNEEGVHVAYHGPYQLTGKVYKEADWFIEVIKNGFYISDVFLGYRQAPHFIIAIARQETGKIWVIRATIDSIIFNNLVKKVRIGKTGEAYIINSEGILQTDRRSGGNLMDATPDDLNKLKHYAGIETFIDKETGGGEFLYATTWLKDKKWLVVVRQEKEDAFKTLRSATYLIILISVIGGMSIIVAAFLLTDRIVKRMEQMDAEKDGLGQQFIRASRLAELGEMAAGFAHEINNPLQIIQNEQSLIDLTLSELKEKGQIKESKPILELEECVRQIKLQVNRCAEITQAILKFGRKAEPVLMEIDLKSFIPEVTAMIQQKAKIHGIFLETNISENTPLINGDPVQLQQVFLNLYNNAMDSIIERHGAQGGELIVKSEAGENNNVLITVTDNGCGISPDNLKRIFTPFFTTKPVGKGTGLGLSVCYGIIDRMGGTMSVSSKQGVGASFIIELLAATQEQHQKERKP